MGSERAAMVIADPPSFDEMSKVEFTSFMKQLCALLVTYSIIHSLHFVFDTGLLYPN
jgi:hypothetical protein